MISCIVVDDEPLALDQLEGYVSRLPDLKLLQSFNNAIKALDYLYYNDVDLMFVDINMPDLSGMEFVKACENPPKVIFTTAHREYAAEGFKVDAADYLLKPISFAAFSQSVAKTKKRYFSNAEVHSENQNEDGDFLFIKTEYKIVRINLHNIKYIEGMGDYVRIHQVDGKPIMALLSLIKITEHLPDSKFMRVHRSYIVNLSEIRTIERNRIVFDQNVYIPVSDQYKDDFKKFIDDNFLT